VAESKRFNIIVGLNGSGKSAILTAISIGLCGKASSTACSTSL
jgi:chromosome segregation ATPase